MNIKIIVLVFALALPTLNLRGQNNTNSPYSGFGIGELEMSSGGRNTAMGQTGIALRSNLFLNTANPASLTSMDPNGFLFDIGVNFDYTRLQNSTKSVDVINGNISWLQMGFPISKKLFGAITLAPKSSVGYNIFTEKSITGTSSTYPATYQGTGGLSEAAGLLGYKLNKNISLGAKIGYLWGNVTQNIDQSIAVSSVIYSINQEDKIYYSGSYFNVGAQITVPVSAKSTLIWGGIAGISSRLNSKISTTITKTFTSSSEIFADDSKSSNSMKLPLDIGTGISLLYGPKWVATFDYKRSDWENASLIISSRKLSTNNSFRGGFEFSPKNDPKTFKQAARYRLGYRYDSGYLKLYNNQIHEQAVTFGVGLPIRKDRSYANFSMELGMRGTKTANLVQERFIKINCSFNLWDKWFIKRQIE